MMDDDGSWDDTSTPLPVEKRQGHLKHFAEFKENFSQEEMPSSHPMSPLTKLKTVMRSHFINHVFSKLQCKLQDCVLSWNPSCKVFKRISSILYGI